MIAIPTPSTVAEAEQTLQALHQGIGQLALPGGPGHPETGNRAALMLELSKLVRTVERKLAPKLGQEHGHLQFLLGFCHAFNDDHEISITHFKAAVRLTGRDAPDSVLAKFDEAHGASETHSDKSETEHSETNSRELDFDAGDEIEEDDDTEEARALHLQQPGAAEPAEA